MIKKIWSAIMNDDVLGIEARNAAGEIYIDASVLTESCGEDCDCINIHCYDGRRYDLTLVRRPDGCSYGADGKPIVENDKPQIRTQRDAMLAMVEAMTAALNDQSYDKYLDEPIDQDGLRKVLETIEVIKNPV